MKRCGMRNVWVILLTFATLATSSSASSRVFPLQMIDMEGEWIGESESNLTFVRMTLDSRGKGSIVQLFNEELVGSYQIVEWRLQNDSLQITVRPRGTKSSPIEVNVLKTSVSRLNMSIYDGPTRTTETVSLVKKRPLSRKTSIARRIAWSMRNNASTK